MPDAEMRTGPLKDGLSFGLLIEAQKHKSPVRRSSVTQLRSLLRRHRLLVLRGFGNGFDDTQAFVDYAQAWGDIMTWPFGAVLDVVPHEKPVDHIFDRSYVPLHWDGMYRDTIPELQLFYCVDAPEPEAGGHTIFVDTISLLHDAGGALRIAWEKASLICRVQKASHYGGEVCSPLVAPHPVTGEKTLRYNEPVDDPLFLNPHTVWVDQISEEHREQLHEMLLLPRYRYVHAWQPGDIVIADNFALLHGRDAVDKHSPRHLRRIHIHASPIHINAALRFEANATHPVDTSTRNV